jgi:hypothetical protein
LINICAELISVQNASKIYFIHDISWLSNFLFYAISVKNNTIELINKKEWQN